MRSKASCRLKRSLVAIISMEDCRFAEDRLTAINQRLFQNLPNPNLTCTLFSPGLYVPSPALEMWR